MTEFLSSLAASTSGIIPENLAAMAAMAIGYALLCVALPALVIGPRLKDKPFAYRMMFYQASGWIYLIVWGFILAFTGLFNPASIWITLVVVPLGAAAYLRREALVARVKGALRVADNLSNGLYNLRRGSIEIGRFFKRAAQSFYEHFLKGRILALIAWVFFVVFIILYFGYFKLHYASYAFTDEETHLYWIQGLVNGNPFPAGLYPHGEHFLVGSIVSLFGLQVARDWLCFSAVSMMIVLFNAYLFLRTVFTSRGAAVFAVGIFLIADTFILATYFRYQYSVPMETALAALFMMLGGMISYLRDKDRPSLALFGLGFALTFEIHFYVTIFALFLLVGFAIVLGIRAFRDKTLFKVLGVCLLSGVLAITPFAVGFALGWQFERSIDWAVEIAQGGNGSASLGDDAQETTEEEKQFQEDIANARESLSLPEFLVYSSTQALMTSATWTFVLFGLEGLVLVYGIVGALICALRKKDALSYLLYLAYGVSWILGFFVYTMYFFGLPQIIYTARSAIFMAIYSIGLFAIPLQIVYDLLRKAGLREKHNNGVVCLMALLALGGYTAFLPTKSLNALTYNFAIQDADMRVCEDLLDNSEDFTWTVISPVNDLSTIRYNGYHYEIIDLLTEIEDGDGSIYIPTRDVYVVVERHPVDFNRSRGDTRYVDGSDMMEYTTELSAEEAAKPFSELGFYGYSSKDRAYYELRQATMSKLYYWMEKVKEAYPSETSVYYEDEYCTVYRIQQDPYFLLNLALDYSELVAKDLDNTTQEVQDAL